MTDHGSALTSDKGIGYAVLFTMLAVGASATMFIGHGTELAGYGFAGAMVAGTLLVAALHIYGY